MNILEKTYADWYDPGENLTIDEAMVKYTGNLFFK